MSTLAWCFTVNRLMRLATDIQLRPKSHYAAPGMGVTSCLPRETFAPRTIDASSGV